MHGDRVERTMKIHDRMTRLATIVVGRRGKLIVVDIFVAVRTVRELDLVLRILPCRRVALGALYRDVLALKRILGTLVLFHAKKRRLPGIYLMALRTLAFLRAPFELARMDVLVAILAVCESERLFEIAANVARNASDLRVAA